MSGSDSSVSPAAGLLAAPPVKPGEPWLWLDTALGEPAWNMAVDEAMLLHAAETSRPLLRFYGWTVGAATFGYSQHIAELEQLTSLRPLIRRCTGGGLVPHDRDWTYSLVFPPSHPWYGIAARDSYRLLHEWIKHSFVPMGMATELASHTFHATPGQCFVGAEQFDVLHHGTKVAGAAQRRSRHGLLIQGSIQPPVFALDRRHWQTQFLQVAARQWQVTWERINLSAAVAASAAELAAAKYSQDKHNRKR